MHCWPSYQTQQTIEPLQRVMNAAARLVLNLKPRDHMTPALQTLHWLPVKYRIQYKLCLLVHRALHSQAPSYLSDIVTSSAAVPGRSGHRSASHQDLIEPRTKLKFGERAFSVAGPHYWNLLPTELKLTTDDKIFRKKLKTHYFVTAYRLIN